MKTTKETLQSLLERYKVYAGEYKKPGDLIQEILICGDLAPNYILPKTEYLSEKEGIFIDNILLLFEENYQKQEFLIHKDCFHPSFDLYYACPETTSAEFCYIIEEALKHC